MKMSNRDLKRATRRHITTASQHVNAAADLAIRAGRAQIPLDEYQSIMEALYKMRKTCEACRLWWTNA